MLFLISGVVVLFVIFKWWDNLIGISVRLFGDINV